MSFSAGAQRINFSIIDFWVTYLLQDIHYDSDLKSADLEIPIPLSQISESKSLSHKVWI